MAPDSLTLLREHPDERVLVHVARADHPQVRMATSALHLHDTAALSTLYGSDAVGEDAGTLTLPASGPGAHA